MCVRRKRRLIDLSLTTDALTHTKDKHCSESSYKWQDEVFRQKDMRIQPHLKYEYKNYLYIWMLMLASEARSNILSVVRCQQPSIFYNTLLVARSLFSFTRSRWFCR